MKAPAVISDTARRYCERFPSSSTLAIARMLRKDQPALYDSVDHARDAVRYVRGKRKNGKGYVIPRPAEFTPLSIPKSDAKPIAPVKLTCAGSGLVISDVHIPYHDERALYCSIDHAIKRNHTDFLLINGDFIDGHQISDHLRDPRLRNWAGEIEMMKGFLAELARHFKRIVYKCGNHESRYDRYMMRKAPELIGLPQFEMRAVLGVDEVGAEYVHANQVIHAGKLTILHGHEFGESVFSPVNPARGMFLRATDCTLSGHQHRTSQHNERTLQGRPIVCFSTGALCDLSPAYRPINKWDHGAALMSFDGKSEFEVQTFRVINGKAY